MLLLVMVVVSHLLLLLLLLLKVVLLLEKRALLHDILIKQNCLFKELYRVHIVFLTCKLLLVVHFGSSFVVIIRVEAIGRGVGGGLSCRGQSLWLWCSERWLA